MAPRGGTLSILVFSSSGAVGNENATAGMARGVCFVALRDFKLRRSTGVMLCSYGNRDSIKSLNWGQFSSGLYVANQSAPTNCAKDKFAKDELA